MLWSTDMTNYRANPLWRHGSGSLLAVSGLVQTPETGWPCNHGPTVSLGVPIAGSCFFFFGTPSAHGQGSPASCVGDKKGSLFSADDGRLFDLGEAHVVKVSILPFLQGQILPWTEQCVEELGEHPEPELWQTRVSIDQLTPIIPMISLLKTKGSYKVFFLPTDTPIHNLSHHISL